MPDYDTLGADILVSIRHVPSNMSVEPGHVFFFFFGGGGCFGWVGGGIFKYPQIEVNGIL